MKPLALITGASSGIGAEFARELARRGNDLILVARRKERLEELARRLEHESGIAVEIVVADLATEEGLASVEQRIHSTGNLELLVNNAGFAGAACSSARMWRSRTRCSPARCGHDAADARGAPRDGGAWEGRDYRRFLGGRFLAVPRECPLLRHQMLDERFYLGPGSKANWGTLPMGAEEVVATALDGIGSRDACGGTGMAIQACGVRDEACAAVVDESDCGATTEEIGPR
jgi:hypothetical protein